MSNNKHKKKQDVIDVQIQKKRKPISYCEFPKFKRKCSPRVWHDDIWFQFYFGFFSYVVWCLCMILLSVIGWMIFKKKRENTYIYVFHFFFYEIEDIVLCNFLRKFLFDKLYLNIFFFLSMNNKILYIIYTHTLIHMWKRLKENKENKENK